MRINKSKVKKIDLQTLKPKRRKAQAHVNDFSNICPYCLSVLRLNTENTWECSGNKLEYWQNEIQKFESMDSKTKQLYMKKLDNPAKFNEFYAFYKETGTVDCGFVNRIFNVTPTYTHTIPDPIIVGKIERGLKRLLTEDEKIGESAIWSNGLEYSTEEIEGFTLVTIPQINFPEEA